MRRFTAFLILFLPWAAVHASPADDAAATAVVYNGNDPEAKALADFYCSSRGIDPGRQIMLMAPVTEEISRGDYDATIALPLRREFVDRGYWMVTKDMMNRPIVISSSIRYVALIRGIPLKIKECGEYPGDGKVQPAPVGTCNAASVDSELSVLGLFTPQISGLLNNPLHHNASGSIFNPLPPPALLLVGRLDAPTSDAVRRMIDDGIRAEKEGLWGIGYIDMRSITSAGYIQGDRMIWSAGQAMRRNGIPVLSDDLPETFQAAFPVTDAAAYYGWYSENIDGPFADAFFRFVPGAFAAHLHSFSATTLRSATKGWTGPLLMHGAAASLGNVYEPYLSFTTDLGIMASTLLSGSNLADAYYNSQPALSWMSILVGDPLYRPYACFADPDSTSPSKSVWTDYRRIILAHEGDVLKSSADLGSRAQETGESLYLEALGAAQMDEGYAAAAAASFRDAAALAKYPVIQFRLLLEQARALEKKGSPDKGSSLLRQGLIRFTAPSQRSLLLAWIARMDPIKTSPQTAPSITPAPATR
jgi:uncharacterized protein (TIGR03790 family)